jgi:hypothetical protein
LGSESTGANAPFMVPLRRLPPGDLNKNYLTQESSGTAGMAEEATGQVQRRFRRPGAVASPKHHRRADIASTRPCHPSARTAPSPTGVAPCRKRPLCILHPFGGCGAGRADVGNDGKAEGFTKEALIWCARAGLSHHRRRPCGPDRSHLSCPIPARGVAR